MPLGPMSGDRGVGTGIIKNADSRFETNIKNGLEDNSSEEILITPEGRIAVKTEVVHKYDSRYRDD